MFVSLNNSFEIIIIQEWVFCFIFVCLFFWLRCAACGILVPPTRDWAVSSSVEAWSLNHWTSREVPNVFLFNELPSISKRLVVFCYFIISTLILEWKDSSNCILVFVALFFFGLDGWIHPLFKALMYCLLPREIR